ncbi:DUF1439 domain-containing protein [Thorsellia kenyensis]|uniref:DUF1439 domain-containing protein n=1 Tax=Thorsellia kenyensis TaxID=1549888 RepID=A0ABV6CC59_9GAMM
MKKLVIIIVAVALLALFLGFNPLRYHLTEERINQYLTERADSKKFNRDIEVPNVAKANIKISEMVVEVGRREPNLVQFNAKANLSLTSLFGDTQTELTFTISASPYFERDKKAIYVKSIEIIDAKTESNRVNRVMPLLQPILSEALSTYFADNPVYDLNPDKSIKEWFAYRYGTGINVTPGTVTIFFGR